MASPLPTASVCSSCGEPAHKCDCTEFQLKLEAVRQASRLLLDLEESVGNLVLGLTSLHDDFSYVYIFLRAFQRLQGLEDQVSAPEKSAVQP